MPSNKQRLQSNNAKIEAIQETLRNKVGTSGEIELTENNTIYDVSKYASAKTNIAVPDLSQTTATENDVVSGKVFYNASGEKTMGVYVDRLQWKCDNIKSLFNEFGFPNAIINYTQNDNTVVECFRGLDTSNVITMQYMFGSDGVSGAIYVDLSGITLNMQNCKNAIGLFKNQSKLEKLPTLININKLEYMNNMFYGCSNLTEIPQLNTSKVTNMNSTFYGCKKLITITLLDMINTTICNDIFNNCQNLTNLTIKNIKISIQIGRGTTWGTLLTDNSIVNTFQELWDLTGSSTQTLTLSTPSLARTESIYVKLIDVTEEMRTQDEYIDNKKPCIVCESTDEGAMTLKEYGISKNWNIA